MGWTPSQADKEYLWDFLSAWSGWKAFHAAPSGPAPPTAERYAEVLAADMAQSRTLH